jgi:hypothetical protein
MKTIKKINIALLLSLFVSLSAVAQVSKPSVQAETKQSPFQKKFRWGISGNQYWGNIKGNDLPETYFAKPCIGYNLRTEYYPVPFIGLSVGAGFQQRGAGIINPDKSGGSFTHPWENLPFDPDSTYRERLRFFTMEVPVSLLIRSPKDLIRGVRPSASAGVNFITVKQVRDVFLSVEDGFHSDLPVTSDYFNRDLGYQFSFGADIDAGGSGLFQVHLVYTKGTKNIYNSGQGNGTLVTYGFRVSWLY